MCAGSPCQVHGPSFFLLLVYSLCNPPEAGKRGLTPRGPRFQFTLYTPITATPVPPFTPETIAVYAPGCSVM